MRVLTAAAILALLWSGSMAQAQDLSRACLRSTTAGDATINCLKSSVLLQRAQLQVLRDLRVLLAQTSQQSIAAANVNAERTNQSLAAIAQTLRSAGTPTVTYPFIDDLENMQGAVFDCLSGDCAKDARSAANQICRQLKFAGQYAFDFTDGEDNDAPKRMRWVACLR